MFENRVKMYREKAGITQVKLACLVGMASPNLSAIERGRLAPWPKVQKSLARALKTTVAELFPEASKNGH